MFQDSQEMEGGDAIGAGSSHLDGKTVQTFEKNFVEVQDILDQNRLLINEINQNHESKIPHNLGRNVGLIRELNGNIRRVVDLYSHLSNSFTKSIHVSPQPDSNIGALHSDSKAGNKRNRPAG